jgi:hypothetical protein
MALDVSILRSAVRWRLKGGFRLSHFAESLAAHPVFPLQNPRVPANEKDATKTGGLFRNLLGTQPKNVAATSNESPAGRRLLQIADFTYNGVTFRYVNTARSWSDAQAACAAIGTGWNLATLTSAAENTAVANWAPFNAWIGLNYVSAQSRWVWSSGQQVSFTSWDNGEPNNLDAETATFLKGAEDTFKGRWNNIPAETQVRSICSVSALPPQLAPSPLRFWL